MQTCCGLVDAPWGKPSELARIDEREEFFGNAADSERRRATEKATKDAKVIEAASKADSTKGAMGEAVNALHMRRTKNICLEEKTHELEIMQESMEVWRRNSEIKSRQRNNGTIII